MTTSNLTKTTFHDSMFAFRRPRKEILFGLGIDYDFQPGTNKLVLTAGDIVNKNFPSHMSNNRVYWTAPEWFAADIGAPHKIRVRMGIPDIDPRVPAYRHTNPMFKSSDLLPTSK